MVIFSELIPTNKEAIASYVAEQIRSASSNGLQKMESQKPKVFSMRSFFDISRKPSFASIIENAKREAERSLRVSMNIKNQLNEIHEALENVDNLDYICKKLSQDTAEAGIKNSESLLSTEKRVQVEPLNPLESAAQTVAVQLQPKKSIEILQSKLSSETHSKSLTEAAALKKHESKFSRNSRISESRSAIKKFTASKIIAKRTYVRSSVQEILDEAKTKHKLNNMEKNKTTIPIPVVNLALN